MNGLRIGLASLVLAATALTQSAIGQTQVPPLAETGFQSIFDGKSLSGWDGDPDFWRVEDGEIVGETKADHQPKQNTFLICRGAKPGDFEFRMKYKLTGAQANSGLQYLSVELPDVAKWVLKGYQADIDVAQTYTGQLYEERGRTFLALRGQISYIPEGGKPGSIGSTGDSNELKSFIHANDWNDLHVIARGNTLIHILNGHVMSVAIDDDKSGRKMDGVIGIQLHKTTAAMKMEVKNVRIKQF
ncbi:MAG TPA: DUF1080 domain-containing protein [Bryobacteraceae bacterium]|nr:DUF1080 domain-containing protein [Bryobacteraceae bacterium]